MEFVSSLPHSQQPHPGTMYWAWWVKSTSSRFTSANYISLLYSRLRLGLPGNVILSVLATKIELTFLASSTRATSRENLIFLIVLMHSYIASKYVFLKFHVCPEAKGSNPTARIILLCVHNPFRGNSNYWKVSQEEAGRIIPERQSEMKRVLRFQFAAWNVRGQVEREEELVATKILLKFQ